MYFKKKNSTRRNEKTIVSLRIIKRCKYHIETQNRHKRGYIGVCHSATNEAT